MPVAKSLPKWAEGFNRTLSHIVSAKTSKFMGGSPVGIAEGRDGGGADDAGLLDAVPLVRLDPGRWGPLDRLSVTPSGAAS